MPHAPLTRRDFLRIAAVGGGLAECGRAAPPPRRELVVPSVSPESAPGVPASYATVCRECPAGCGAVARHRDGRAIKLEGNPDHPIGRGALCARGQAALQGLYDPDRVRGPLARRDDGGFDPIGWDEALRLTGERLARARAAGPGRVALVSGLEAGSLGRLEAAWATALGSERALAFEPLAYEPLRAAMELCFGIDAVPRIDLAGADFILALGADFLDTWISPVEATRQFAALKSPAGGRMATVVHAGPRLSLTAAAADRRLFVRPGDEALLGLATLRALVTSGRELSFSAAERATLAELTAGFTAERVAPRLGATAAEIDAIARRFVDAEAPVALGGSPLGGGPAAVEAAAAALLLDAAVDGGARLRRHALGRLARPAAIEVLLGALAGGEVDVLVVRESNPCFGMKAAGPAFDRVPWVVALTPYLDETAARAHLILPVHTPLEAWGDFEAEDGVVGLQQPAMGAVHDTRHAGDVLLALADAAGLDVAAAFGAEDFRGYLRAAWMERHRAAGDPRPFEAFFAEALAHGGVFEATAPAPRLVLAPALAHHRFAAGEAPAAELVLHAFPSIALHDGRGANKGWLQELPDPVTKAVWGIWVEMHPETAREHGLAGGGRVRVESDGGAFEAPLLVHAAVARGVAAVPIGQGHARYGRNAAGRGSNPFDLLPPPWAAGGAVPARVAPAGEAAPGELVVTTREFDPGERRLAPVATPAELAAAAADGAGGGRVGGDPFLLPLPESYDPESDTVVAHEHRGHRWGMAIDVNACTGCSACVTACYAENNIPVVGKQKVAEGREMAWITLQRYDLGPDPERAAHAFVPMLCQHCDAAPCEPVCPVFAAYHTEEGLNGQVYNRCIGTRYCSNNCPYKVRRFNWHSYRFPAPLHWQLNPDVTVRDRGVMEKCTFCVQRITAAKDRAGREGRALADGEVAPACAGTCPARAIVFGDLLDLASEVARLARRDPRRYQVLGELRTRPAVTYLMKMRQELG